MGKPKKSEVARLDGVIEKTKKTAIEITGSISSIFLCFVLLILNFSEWEWPIKLFTAFLCIIVIAIACGAQFGARIVLNRVSRELQPITDDSDA
jgi:hypothetical protein